MSKEHGDRATARNHLPSPPRWKGERSLDLVYQLNERCLELLSQLLPSSDRRRTPFAFDIDDDQWRTDLTVRRRVARLPFVIVDVHFMDRAWWQRVREPLNAPANSGGAFFSSESAESLMHETLMFAWHAAQSDPRTACLTVGMSREVSAAIAALTMRDVRYIASAHADEIAPRWHDWPDLWQPMLHAAQSGDEERLTDVQFQAMALLSGTLLANDS